MNGKNILEQTESAARGCVQRRVIWPAFWTLWCLVFGAFAITCWVVGEGNAELMALCTGIHVMGFITNATRWIEAI